MRRPVIILYILACYVVFQFCWWAYLLIDLNDEVYTHRIETVRLMNLPDPERKVEVDQLEKKIHQRRWMVYGEGGVFLALLVWGSYITLGSFRKEIALARQQKNFLLSITHEFKSPLASIKLYLQTLLKHDLDKEKEISFINSAITDTERLNTLVENALLANLIDHKGYLFSREPVNMSALVRLMIQRFHQVPGHERIEAHIEDGIFLSADRNAMIILIGNLLENAAKYSDKESPIVITLESNVSSVKLTVADNGFGIPDGEKEKVFSKFYRIGNEETRRTKGTGLGLFIVKYIVEKHDGKIVIADNKPRGSVFIIDFALKESTV